MQSSGSLSNRSQSEWLWPSSDLHLVGFALQDASAPNSLLGLQQELPVRPCPHLAAGRQVRSEKGEHRIDLLSESADLKEVAVPISRLGRGNPHQFRIAVPVASRIVAGLRNNLRQNRVIQLGFARKHSPNLIELPESFRSLQVEFIREPSEFRGIREQTIETGERGS